jgi:hypothetical protein
MGEMRVLEFEKSGGHCLVTYLCFFFKLFSLWKSTNRPI